MIRKIESVNWRMRRLYLGKDFEKESELDMGVYVDGHSGRGDIQYEDFKTKAGWSVRLAKNELERCVLGQEVKGEGWQIMKALQAIIMT